MHPTRARRRYTLDLTDERFDFLLSRIAVEFPEHYRTADALLELLLRAADVEPAAAVEVVARRVAFGQARLEAATLLAEMGRRLAAAAREQTGVLAAEVQAALIDAETERRAAHAAAVAEAAERLRAGQ
jgi:hypothetical protein